MPAEHVRIREAIAAFEDEHLSTGSVELLLSALRAIADDLERRDEKFGRYVGRLHDLIPIPQHTLKAVS